MIGFDRDSILNKMSVRPLCWILAFLVVAAYVGATTLVTAPSDIDTSNVAINGVMHEQDGPADRMPCKGRLPGCVTDLGCIFLVSLPAPDLTFVTMTAWSSVIYDNASEGLRGRSIKPALGPPISLA